LVLVLLILVGLRIPFLIEEIIPTIPQFRWMLIGERLAEGGFLYRDLYDYIAPLSALVFQLIDYIFGRSLLASAILSIVVVLIQSVIFNNFLLSNKAYNEGTYIPAYCYAVFMSLHFDFLVISPSLLSLTFVLLALSNIYKRIDNQTRDELFMRTGVYLGIAAMFFLPTVMLFLTFLIILIVYSNSLLRRLLLMSVGFALVGLIVTGYFYAIGALDGFKAFFLSSLWNFSNVNYFSSWRVIAFLAFPVLLVVFTIFYIYWKGKYANFQLKFQQAMLFLLVGSGMMLLIVIEHAYFSWIFMMPVAAFFMAHLLLLMKNKLYLEGLNIVMLILVFLISSISYKWSLEKEESYFVRNETPIILEGKKILVLGDELFNYQSATSATPYLNWRINRTVFQETAYYDNLTNILAAFESDPPEMIVDQEGLMPKVMELIPILKKTYLPVPNYPGYYRNINN